MNTAATSFPERNAAEVADLVFAREAAAPEVVARRARQRRQMYIGQVASYSLGASVLLLYAYDGAISMGVPSLFWLGGLLIIGTFTVLSEAGFGDRFEDHYLTVFQISAHTALQVVFLLAVPTVGVAFLAVLFLIFAFGTLRMTSSQAMVTWGLTTCGLVVVFLGSDLPIGLPVTTRLQRTASMLCFVLVIGQCATLGLFGATLRKILYRRSIELKAAYQRIEELAELDELTGSYNRRCIMRLLDTAIEESRQASTPCAIALIDLDWSSSASTMPTAIPSATRCCAPSPSPFLPTSARPTASAATAARNFCCCCPERMAGRHRACSTACAKSSPISTGMHFLRACA